MIYFGPFLLMVVITMMSFMFIIIPISVRKPWKDIKTGNPDERIRYDPDRDIWNHISEYPDRHRPRPTYRYSKRAKDGWWEFQDSISEEFVRENNLSETDIIKRFRNGNLYDSEFKEEIERRIK